MAARSVDMEVRAYLEKNSLNYHVILKTISLIGLGSSGRVCAKESVRKDR